MAKFRAIVNAVRQAITGNATTADVLSGKTFMSSASPNEQTGAMANNGAVTASLTADGQVYTIPAGYHNGAGTVTANIPADMTEIYSNINQSASWPAQSINLGSMYDKIIILPMYNNTLSNPEKEIGYNEINNEDTQTAQQITVNSGAYTATRSYTIYDHVITFDDGKSYSGSTDNTFCVPLKIYGKKTTP